ncbi:hypothetical protein SAY86_016589 [Trapa natans]|uniref:Uncharacterized protein n=1 Tax=Trapa natans TaxID=22666 RepID=A0AAN7L9S8_TRANT|nr:hypothetical protein SAY86_016589 [Trapa natans]
MLHTYISIDMEYKQNCLVTFALWMLSVSLLLCQQVGGEISYNGYKLDEFIPQKTAAYISQNDLHIAEMTVRETLDFSARCQGIGSREGHFLLHDIKEPVK